MRRRDFLKVPCALLAGSAAAGLGVDHALGSGRYDKRYWHEASHYTKSKGKSVQCNLCHNHCPIDEGELGLCGVRINQSGILYSRVYGRPVSMAVDPIEKKPLFHYKPACKAFSLATAGCNFGCLFCQNWEISQSKPEDLPTRYGVVSPERVVAEAKKRGAGAIAFTYNEPTVFFEYMLAIARLAKKAGIPGVMISNGFAETKPIDQLCQVMGAIKVDFKSYEEKYYRDICKGELKPVLNNMKRIRKNGTWLEMVHLTLPTLNDGEDQLKRLCGWVLKNLGPDVPIHFTRFHPTYKLRNLPVTPVASLERAFRIAREAGVHYPYVGNLPGHEGENTICHHCKHLLIQRVGFRVTLNVIAAGKCPNCGQVIPGVWD